MISSVKEWPLGLTTLPGEAYLTLWWVWCVSDVWCTTWVWGVGIFVPDRCVGGVGARECPSRSDCSSRWSNLLFCTFSWASSSVCRCRISSCLRLSFSWRNWSVAPFWSNSCASELGGFGASSSALLPCYHCWCCSLPIPLLLAEILMFGKLRLLVSHVGRQLYLCGCQGLSNVDPRWYTICCRAGNLLFLQSSSSLARSAGRQGCLRLHPTLKSVLVISLFS